MSVDVISAVLKRSSARGVDRVVLLVLADVAHPDGVGWLKQTTIGERANCSEREVRYAVEALMTIGELERRHAQLGRRRLNVYRVCLEPVGQIDVDYERIPYALDQPFSGLRPAEIAARHTADDRKKSAGRERGSTTGNPEQDDRQSTTPAGGTSLPLIEPSLEPSLEPSWSRSGPVPTPEAVPAKPDRTGPGEISRLSIADGLAFGKEPHV